ncbi:MAG TPA: alpha/beta hydrolase [Acidimicrobiales bacterium]|nr:alpha/beta hydrolase [Acidimicrobiales bacterium]
MTTITDPRLEGTIAAGKDRKLGFAEFGDPQGRAFVWLHGTPGARRQIPEDARLHAAAHGLRVIGIDRPGTGLSTDHVYPNVRAWAADLEALVDKLGIDELGVIGLSGGGPFALASGVGLGERVRVIGVLGGVAPTQGPDAIRGGLTQLGVTMAPVIARTRGPLGAGISQAMRLLRPVGSPALEIYARLSPPGDRRLLGRPEFKAMFLDDLLNGRRRPRLAAPLSDVLCFSRDWGFAVGDVTQTVIWWHGDADHIIPYHHGQHMVERLPNAELRTIPGESHLGGLGAAEEVLTTLVDKWGPTTR